MAPHSCTLLGTECLMTSTQPSDDMLKKEMKRVYDDVASTATEFNCRGDLFAGSQIAGFLRVSRAMETLGAI